MRVTDDVNKGAVVAALEYWCSLNRSAGLVNCISSDEFARLGHAPTVSDNLEPVRRVT